MEPQLLSLMYNTHGRVSELRDDSPIFKDWLNFTRTNGSLFEAAYYEIKIQQILGNIDIFN